VKKIIQYIGSKEKLLDFLDEVIFSKYEKEDSKINFYDLFSGTNVVSNYTKETTKWNIKSNDFSNYSKILFSLIFFDMLSKKEIEEIKEKLEILDKLDLKDKGFVFNELSVNGNVKTIEDQEKTFGNQKYKSRMFFSEKVGKKIDTIKDKIKEWKDNNEFGSEKIEDILMTFLVNYADKNSNTTSVYGAYLKTTNKLEKETPFLNNKLLQLLEYKGTEENKRREIKIINKDIINALEEYKKETTQIKKNIIYLDPPYSTRTYESNYHILNYIVDLNITYKSIKYNSKTAQSADEIRIKNPFSSKRKTYGIFKEMIKKSLEMADNLYISYNTDGLIKQNEIEEILNELNDKDIKLKTYKKSYKRFKSANSETKKLKEELNKLKHIKDKTSEDKLKLQKLENEIKNKEAEKDKKNLEEIIWHFSRVKND